MIFSLCERIKSTLFANPLSITNYTLKKLMSHDHHIFPILTFLSVHVILPPPLKVYFRAVTSRGAIGMTLRSGLSP